MTANLDKDDSDSIWNLLFSLPQPVIEVAHHYNINDQRYTKVFELSDNGILSRKNEDDINGGYFKDR